MIPRPGGGGTIVAPHATTVPTRAARAREIASDVLIATALIWALPLAVAAVAALVRLL